MSKQFALICVVLATSFIALLLPQIEHFMVESIATRDICSTRNMSHDIRGDIPIKRNGMMFNNSAWGPLDPVNCQNKQLV